MHRLTLFSFVVALLSLCNGALTCATDDDCSLNGICLKCGTCKCDPGWRSADCSELDLQPAARWSGYNHTNATGPDFYKQGLGNSSWGGAVIQDAHDKGLFHLLVDQLSHGCGLGGWRPFSTIIRAESRTGPAGPYTYAQDVFPMFHHNAFAFWSPADKKYLLYFIGRDVEDWEAGTACKSQKWNNTISVSSSLDLREWGPATPLVINVTNPAPWPLWSAENPTAEILLGAEKNNIYHAAYHTATHKLVVEPHNTDVSEDPFLWRDKRGHWHFLVHYLVDVEEYNLKYPRVGAHAFARSWEGPWTFNDKTLAYNTTVHFTDGTRIDYYRRERPKLFFSDDGEMTPLYLINGVQEFNSSASYTLIQPVGAGWKG